MKRLPYLPFTLVLLGFLLMFSACQTTGSGNSPAYSERENSYRQKIDSARMLAQSGQFPEANKILSDLLSELETSEEPLSWKLELMARFFRAGTFQDMNRPKDSLQDFERALALHEANDEKTAGFSRDLYHKVGMARGGTGDHRGAIAAFKKAIEMNELADPPDPVFASRMHSAMAVAYKEMRIIPNAISELEKSLDILRHNGLESDRPGLLGFLSMELSQLHRATSDFRSAARVSLEAAQYLEQEGKDPNRIATAYYFRAINLMQAGIQDGQYDAYTKALSYFDKTTQPNFEYMAVASYNLANFLQKLGDLVRAEYYFSQAEETYGHVLRVLRARAQSQPGTIPPEVTASFESRHADAARRTGEMKAARTRPVTVNPDALSPEELATIQLGPNIYIYRVNSNARGIAGGTAAAPRLLQLPGGNQILDIFYVRGPETAGPFRVISHLKAGKEYFLNPAGSAEEGFRLTDSDGESAALNFESLQGNSNTLLSTYIRHVLNPTMDEVGNSVLLENDKLRILFEPDLLYTMTDKESGKTSRGRRGFEMDFAISSGKAYLLETDISAMTSQQFLEESGYKEKAQIVWIPVACDGETVTYEFERPAARQGERITFSIRVIEE